MKAISIKGNFTAEINTALQQSMADARRREKELRTCLPAGRVYAEHPCETSASLFLCNKKL